MWLWQALAGRFVWESLKQVSLGLRSIALGPAEERRLQALRETALRKTLEELLPGVGPDDQTYLAETFGRFSTKAGPARRVLEAVLERRPVPAAELRAEISRSVELEQIEQAWPIEFDQFAVAYGERLRDGLFEDACRVDSPLFHLLCVYQLENITRGISGSTGESRKPRDVLVREFMDMYLGSREHPKPFGGRDADLERLDEWLQDSTRSSYAILAAEAGRGKSALLVHWVVRLGFLQDSTGRSLKVVYFPISQRKETNAEEVVLSSLAGRLANRYGQPPPQTDSLIDLRATFLSYLRERPTAEERLLVVLDGLDEAAGWEVGGSLFPEIPPQGLRVLVAARSKTGDPGETGWRRQLEWDRDARKCELMRLGGLDEAGIRDVLEKMGSPLGKLAREIDVVAKLHELSEGDPLLVGLWVEHLQERTAGPEPFNVALLEGIPPRLEGFFDAWFRDQEHLWQRQGRLGFKQRTVRRLANLCAFARGPLKRADVLALAPDIFSEGSEVDEAARELSRFIVGDGRSNGYVFSHPRLGQYFAEELEPVERQGWNRRFLEYCWGTFETLRSGELRPPQAPAYAVHWCSSHLPRRGGRLYALLCEEWLRAWEFVDGTPAGFLADAERARVTAQADGPRAVGKLIRAELCLASVTSRAARVDPDVLAKLVALGIVNPMLAGVIARRMANPGQRALALLRLAACPECPDHATWLREAWEAAQKVADEGAGAWVMAEVAAELPEGEREAAWRHALEAAKKVTDEARRAWLTAGLAAKLPEGELALLKEIWEAAQKVTDEGVRVWVQAQVAARLPEGEPEAAWRHAWEAAHKVTDEAKRAWLMAGVAAKLPEGEQEAAWRQAWEAALSVSYVQARVWVMAEVAAKLPEGERSLLRRIRDAALELTDERARAKVMAEVAAKLPEGERPLLKGLWEAAQKVADERDLARVMTEVAVKLPEREQEAVWRRALGAAQKVSNEEDRARLMVELATKLPEGEREAARHQAWEAVKNVTDEGARARVMAALAANVPEAERALLKTIWETVQKVAGERSRAWVMAEVAAKLPEGDLALLKEIWEAAQKITDEGDRARVMAAVAAKLPEGELALLKEIWEAAQKVTDEGDRAWVMAAVAAKLPEGEREAAWRQAWQAALKISYADSRAWVMTAVATKLPEGEREAAWRQAWETAQGVTYEQGRVCVMVEVAANLPEGEREAAWRQAWEAAQKIADQWARAGMMALVARKLPERYLACVLGEVWKLAAHEPSADALEPLGQRWSDMCRAAGRNEYGEFVQTIRAFSREGRPQLLRAIKGLLPVIEAFGGTEALQETVQAVQDVSRWWP